MAGLVCSAEVDGIGEQNRKDSIEGRKIKQKPNRIGGKH